MSPSRILQQVLASAGLADLGDRAVRGARLARDELLRVVSCGSPLAAAALADAAREHASGAVVLHPWTLRVRAPGVPFAAEDATRVSHAADALGGIASSEAQIVGALPPDLPLGLALEMVRTVKVARPDLTLRAFSARRIDAIAAAEGSDARHVLGELRRAGLDTLDWEPGEGSDLRTIAVHRLAFDQGYETAVPVGYAKGGVDAAFVDRLLAVRDAAEHAGRVLSVVPLPDRSEGASPLDGTAGTEDLLACALARLALGHCVKHVTVDAHVTGHKLAALLFSAGADDVVGAQTASRWAPPSGDGPRPLNPDRMRRVVIEARRSPELRDALFRTCTASAG